MPRTILKLADDDYIEWSSVVDAPVTYIMSREQMLAWMTLEVTNGFGQVMGENPQDRLARVDAKGTSSHLDASAEETISGNRAGPQESQLTLEQIRKAFRSHGHWVAFGKSGHVKQVSYEDPHDPTATYGVWVDA